MSLNFFPEMTVPRKYDYSHLLVKDLLHHIDEMNEKEQKFINDINRGFPRLIPSDKQLMWLKSLYDKYVL